MQALILNVKGHVSGDDLKIAFNLQLNDQDFPSDSVFTFLADDQSNVNVINKLGTIFNNLISFEIPKSQAPPPGIYNYRIHELTNDAKERTPVCGRLELKKVPTKP